MSPGADDRSLYEIEAAAFRAWPAREVVRLGSWWLRFTDGVTRRANSVSTTAFPSDPAPRETSGLDEQVAAAESFYRGRNAVPRFQITRLTQPAGLDARLASRGYAIETPVSIQVRTLGGAAASDSPAPAAVHTPIAIERRPTDDWLAVAVDRGRFAAQAGVFAALLARIGERALYAVARRDGAPAGVALGVLDGAWLGIFSMRTLPEHRRCGVGRALLDALAASGSRRGARNAYLQVERDNAPALALYARAGFRERYGYHYRRAE